ncbi:MAG: sodium:solute symporter family protein [Gemmatimonadota bacterium]
MSVPLVVFGLYFALVFLIGWLSLQRTDDASDYWIAGGRLGWLLGGATMAATHTSAGTFIGMIGVVYTVGWSFGWLILSIPIAYFIMAAVLAPRFTRVRRLTLPDFIEARYDSKVAKAVAAVIILIAVTVYIQAQIVAGGLIANIVFGMSATGGMVLFTVILLAYTVIGGMIAVVYTDFLQLAIMAVGVLIAAPLTVRQLDGFANLLGFAEAIQPLTFSWDGMPGTLLFTMGLAFLLGGVAAPEKVVRLYAMRDMRTIRRGVLFTIVTVTVLNLLVATVALGSIVLFPKLPTGDLAMPIVARAILPPFVGALMLAAITSAMMSTVDSLLIVAGSALSEDIYRSLLHPEASHRRRLVVARVGILVVGTVPLIMTLSGVSEGELVQFIVLLFTALMASSFFMPVVAGVYWRRANKQGAIAAMLGGVTSAIAWEVYGPSSVDPVLPGFVASAILLVVGSLLAPPPPASATEPYFPHPSG